MIGKTNATAGGVDVSKKPNVDFDGKWSGWHIETYEGKPYWEALFASSGTLTNYGGACECDAWGIGGGGAGGCFYKGGNIKGNGGGSGYTNMIEGLTLPTKTTAITIGAGGNTFGSGADRNTDRAGGKGGTTSFLTLSCSGGNGGSGTAKSGGSGGSNGSTGWTSSDVAGVNGAPGAGKIMSKFWSTEHNTEYGEGGFNTSSTSSGDSNGGGGGGYMDVGAPGSTSGRGYGGGGGGARGALDGNYAKMFYDWQGKSGCLIIRIPI